MAFSRMQTLPPRSFTNSEIEILSHAVHPMLPRIAHPVRRLPTLGEEILARPSCSPKLWLRAKVVRIIYVQGQVILRIAYRIGNGICYENIYVARPNINNIALINRQQVRMPVGTLVVAKLPRVSYYLGGIVLEHPSHLNRQRYLIYFRNNHFRYVNHADVHHQLGNLVDDPDHILDHPFVRRYLTQFPTNPKKKLKINQKVQLVVADGHHTTEGVVVDIDCSLVKIMEQHRCRWRFRDPLTIL